MNTFKHWPHSVQIPCLNFFFLFLSLFFFSDSCEGDFIRTTDADLCIQGLFRHEPNRNTHSLAGHCRNRTSALHPTTHTLISSDSNNMTTVELYSVQTSHTMPFINQTTPSNYHINQNPGTNNNYMLTQTPEFVQGSNISPPSQLIYKSNQSFTTMSCPAVPNLTSKLIHTQSTSTYQPFTEESQPMLHPPSVYYDMPHYVKNANTSNDHCQYLKQSPRIVRPNLAPAIQQANEYSHLAACNTSERPRNSTNQATHKTMTEVYAEQLKEVWLQQQQQQCGEHNLLDLLNNIQPPIAHHSHQDAVEASVPLLFLPSSHDRVRTAIQTGKQIIQCFQHVCIFFILQCHLIFGQYTYISA